VTVVVQDLKSQVPKDSKKPTEKSNGNNNGKSESFKMKISSKPTILKPMADLVSFLGKFCWVNLNFCFVYFILMKESFEN